MFLFILIYPFDLHALEAKSSLKCILSNLVGKSINTISKNPSKKFPTTKEAFKELELHVEPNSRVNGLSYEEALALPGRNTFRNEVIKKLEEEGGEVRYIGIISADLIPKFGKQYLSYFRVTKSGRPILAIEKNASTSTIEHELQHFRDWKKQKHKFMEKGLSEKEAAIKSYYYFQTPKKRRLTERNAVREEIKIGNFDILNPRFLERAIYPEMAAVKKELSIEIILKKKMSKKVRRIVNSYFDQAIKKAIRIRRIQKYLIEKN